MLRAVAEEEITEGLVRMQFLAVTPYLPSNCIEIVLARRNLPVTHWPLDLRTGSFVISRHIMVV